MNNPILRSLFVLTSAAIFIGTIILNLLAIVYIRSRRDKTSIAILVVNLAIADIIHASMSSIHIHCSSTFSLSSGNYLLQ